MKKFSSTASFGSSLSNGRRTTRNVFPAINQFLFGIVFCVASQMDATAVVVANPIGGDFANHQMDPANGSQWDNVLLVNSAGGGVYLGGGWVLTAEHISDEAAVPSVSFGGGTISADASFIFSIDNPDFAVTAGLSQDADLTLFRLTETIPSLPTVNLGEVSAGTDLTVVGFGGGKSWYSNTVEGPPVNQFLTFTEAQDNNDVIAFRSDYDTATTGEGQAVGGDSGGGAFFFDGTEWVLGGINIAVATDPDPDLTFYASLSFYEDQILDTINTNGSAVPEPSSLFLALTSISLVLCRKR